MLPIMAPSRPVLAPSWHVLAQSWHLLAPSWAILAPSWRHLGAIFARLGAILSDLGAILRCLGAILRGLGAILGHLGRILASQKLPKIALRGFQDTSQDEVQHRIVLEAFGIEKTYKNQRKTTQKKPVLASEREARLSWNAWLHA